MSNTKRLNIKKTLFSGLCIIKRKKIKDDRGFLTRVFCTSELKKILKKEKIRQVNHTFTLKKGTVRGLHFQYPPSDEIKIVTCIKGKILDVVVDLRKNSPTFLRHYKIILSESNCISILIPGGFAHGFQTLKSNTEVLYLHSKDFNPIKEGGINAIDPKLKIKWPMIISKRSKKDEQIPILDLKYNGI